MLLAAICRYGLVPGVDAEHARAAMADLMDGRMLETNLALFNEELSA